MGANSFKEGEHIDTSDVEIWSQPSFIVTPPDFLQTQEPQQSLSKLHRRNNVSGADQVRLQVHQRVSRFGHFRRLKLSQLLRSRNRRTKPSISQAGSSERFSSTKSQTKSEPEYKPGTNCSHASATNATSATLTSRIPPTTCTLIY